MVATVHDLLWRRVPDAYPRPGPDLARGGAAPGPAPGRPVRRARRGGGRRPGGAGAPSEAITVIPMGSDHLPPPDLAAAAAHLSRLGINGPFLLSVGTLEPRKNQARLIEAYGRIRAVAARTMAVGAGGTERMGPQVVPAPGVTLAGSGPPPSCRPSTPCPGSWPTSRSSRGSGSHRSRPWPSAPRWWPARCPARPGRPTRSTPTTPTRSPRGCCGWPPTTTSGRGCTGRARPLRRALVDGRSPGATSRCGTRRGGSGAPVGP